MKNKGAAIVIVGLALAGIGFAIAKSKSSDGGGSRPTTDDPRMLKAFEDGQGLWAFAVFASQGSDTIVHGPEGTFDNEKAALTAGQIWMHENPPV